MQQSSSGRIRLPKELLAQLDVNLPPSKPGERRNGLTSRKAQRRAARVEKKSKSARPRHLIHERNSALRNTSREHSVVIPERSRQNKAPKTATPAPQDDALPTKVPPPSGLDSPTETPAETKPRKLKRKAQNQLDRDEADIAALEKKLGISGKKGLPQAFTDDGLSGLLDGLENGGGDDTDTSSGREVGQEWLRQKRQRAHDDEQANDPESGSDFLGLDDLESDNSLLGETTEENSTFEVKSEATPNHHFSSRTQISSQEGYSRSNHIEPNKTSPSDSAELFQLQKLARRCVNRLSEANFVATVSDAERLYQDQPRRLVSEALLEATLNHIGGRDSLSDSFIILYSGFLAAIFKAIGPDFGVEVVRRVIAAAEQSLDDGGHVDTSANLLSTLTQLFNFRVVSSELIYDFVRVFVTEISERNTQLLLRIMKVCGPQLRQEDPSSLKDIVLHLQSAVAKIPPHELSVRTKFMIEMITDLKNNKIKPALNAAGLTQEQIHRMKKLLASLGQGHTQTTEPLRISLSDLHDDTKTGQWWLAGAKHRQPVNSAALSGHGTRHKEIDDVRDMQELASDQRMNTDIRRSIFISLMSASDGKDAYSRILGLSLKKSQDMEIPKVLIHCLTAEEYYNPYYAFVADQLCAERRMRISFQISLWDALRQAENEEEGDDLPGSPTLRSLIHLAKLFGELVARQRLDLKGLKNLEFAIISARMHAFLEVFLLTVILRTRRRREHPRQAIHDIFQPLRDTPETARAVRIFVHSTVRKTDMVANPSEQERLRHGCDIVDEILQES